MQIPTLVTLVAALLLPSSTALAATLVAKETLRALISIESREDGSGQMSGLIRNQSATQIKAIKLTIRHNWIWPYAGNDQPDTRSRTAYVSIGAALEPGMGTTFASLVAAPRHVPDNARYSSTVTVHAVTRMICPCGAPAAQ